MGTYPNPLRRQPRVYPALTAQGLGPRQGWGTCQGNLLGRLGWGAAGLQQPQGFHSRPTLVPPLSPPHPACPRPASLGTQGEDEGRARRGSGLWGLLTCPVRGAQGPPEP